MKTTTSLAIGGLFFCAVSALAADTAPAPDKWEYTLFNPVPPGALREINPDRPDKTNSPQTVDAGHLQIEFGLFDYTYNRDHYHGADAREEALDLGQLNFRLGVLNNLEFNAIVNSVDYIRTTDYLNNHSARQAGFGDLVLGGKLNFWGNDGADGLWQTALGIQPQFKIPTARDGIGNGHAELFVGVPLAINLPANCELTAETTVSWERNSTSAGDVTGWQNSASLDHDLTENLDCFLEYWSHVSTERHQEAQQTIDAGLGWKVADNLVLDTCVDFGLNRASSTIEWLAGATFRF